jgi:outer membrane protein assembly factor BamB
MVGYDAAHTAANASETTLGVGNVSSLQEQWTATVPSGFAARPAVANGVMFVGSNAGELVALDANGVQNCSGTPKTCAPLWTGLTGGAIDFSSPAVYGGVVYVGSEDGKLYAFDANGTTNCSGTPKTCAPLWTAQTRAGIEASPTVAYGRVYVGSIDRQIYAFDAAGNTNCSGTPKTCAPMWSVPTAGIIVTSAAVSAHVVYVSSEDDNLYALDAFTGAYLWHAHNQIADFRDPTVANGFVYASNYDGTLYAFDASGTTNCTGEPKLCSAVWTAPMGPIDPGALAVANNVVYMGSSLPASDLYAFDALGETNCAGTPKVCTPLWTANTGYTVTAPTVANGVVYAGANAVYAYDAAGAVNCSGSPKACSPLWSAPGSTVQETGSPTISNGHLYAIGSDGYLYVYAIPG